MTTTQLHPTAAHRSTSGQLSRFLFILVCSAATLLPVRAQQATSAEALAKYDRNHNGKLDPDELSAQAADETKAAKTPVKSRLDADKAATVSWAS